MAVQQHIKQSQNQRAAIYVRVSTAGQEDGSSLETQEDACRKYAERLGYVAGDLYREVHTGTELWERPKLTELRQAIRQHDIAAVVCYAIDRFTRDPVHLGVLISEAEHAGVAVHFVTEPLDDTPEGQLIRFVRGYAAKVEHEKIRERSLRGRRARALSGALIPARRPRYGYAWGDAKRTLVIHEPTAVVVRRIFAQAARGVPLRAIAQQLTDEGVETPSRTRDFWRHTAVRCIVADPLYTGQAVAFRFQNRRVQGKHVISLRPIEEHIPLPDGTVPPLVTLAAFVEIQERLRLNKERASRNSKNPEAALLQGGLVVCGSCRHTMSVRAPRNRNPYTYMCTNIQDHSTSQDTRPGIAVHTLDDVVWEHVQQVLTRPQVVADELQRMLQDAASVQDTAAVDRALAEIDRKRRNLVRNLAFVEGETAQLVAAELGAFDAQKRSLEAEREMIVSRQHTWQLALRRLGEIEAWCQTVASKLGALTYQQRRLALDALGVRAVVWGADHRPRYEIVAAIPFDVPVVDTTSRRSGPQSSRGSMPTTWLPTVERSR